MKQLNPGDPICIICAACYMQLRYIPGFKTYDGVCTCCGRNKWVTTGWRFESPKVDIPEQEITEQ